MKNRLFYRELNKIQSLSSQDNIPVQTKAEKDEMETIARLCIRRESQKGRKTEMRKLSVAACVACIVIAGSQTAMAKEFFQEITRISTGTGYVAQNEAPNMSEAKAIAGKMFDQIKGTVYDADGNAIMSFEDLKEGMALYTVDGEEIDSIEPDGTITTRKEAESSFKLYDSWEDAVPYINLDLMLPEFPEGYKLDSIKLYPNTETGKSNYVFAQYVNAKGKKLVFETRNLSEDGGYSVGTEEKIESAEVNGNQAVVIGKKEIIWEQDDQQLSILFRDEKPGKKALVKMAESLKNF